MSFVQLSFIITSSNAVVQYGAQGVHVGPLYILVCEYERVPVYFILYSFITRSSVYPSPHQDTGRSPMCPFKTKSASLLPHPLFNPPPPSPLICSNFFMSTVLSQWNHTVYNIWGFLKIQHNSPETLPKFCINNSFLLVIECYPVRWMWGSLLTVFC